MEIGSEPIRESAQGCLDSCTMFGKDAGPWLSSAKFPLSSCTWRERILDSGKSVCVLLRDDASWVLAVRLPGVP